MFGSLFQTDRWKNWVLQELKNIKFPLPNLEMIAKSKFMRSVASNLVSCNSCLEGRLLEKVELCRVESAAWEMIEQFVMERSVMNNRKRVEERTEPFGTPLLIGLGPKPINSDVPKGCVLYLTLFYCSLMVFK